MVIEMNIERVDMACLPKIADAVKINADKYLNSEDYWLEDFIRSLGFLTNPSNLEIRMPEFAMGGEKPSDNDLKNAILLHKALDIAPELSGNGAFWTILSHHCADFIRYRLQLKEDDDKLISKISVNFVFKESLSKRDRRKGVLPRLWSIADMTFDPANTGNEYWLTAVALEDSDMTFQLLDRNIFMNKDVAKAFLERVYKRSKEGNPMPRKEWRELMKYLHALSNVVLLEFMTRDNLNREMTKFEAWYARNMLMFSDSKEDECID